MPVAKRRKMGDHHNQRRESSNGFDRHGSRDVEDPEYMGSLLAEDVDRYEVRVEEINQDMEALDVESIKRQVLDTHFSARSRPSSSSSSAPMPSLFSSYTKMDDFTAIVTATVLQALPTLSKLMRLMDVWSVRLAVLTKVPPLLWELDIAEEALKSGWGVLETANGGEDQELTRGNFEIMQNTLQDRVTTLGRDLDYMLDTLEGREDTLPDAWLDRMESIEDDYGKWVVSVDRHIRQVEWEKMARARKEAQDARRAAEMQAAEEARKQAEAAAREAGRIQEEQDARDAEEARMRHAKEAEELRKSEEQAALEADEKRKHLELEEARRLEEQAAAKTLQKARDHTENLEVIKPDVSIAQSVEKVAEDDANHSPTSHLPDVNSQLPSREAFPVFAEQPNNDELPISPPTEIIEPTSPTVSPKEIVEVVPDHPEIPKDADNDLVIRPYTATGSESSPSLGSPAHQVSSSPLMQESQTPDSTDMNEKWSLVDSYKERHQPIRSKSSSSNGSGASAKSARASKRHSRNISSVSNFSPSVLDQSGYFQRSPPAEATSNSEQDGGLGITGFAGVDSKFPSSIVDTYDDSLLSTESSPPDQVDTIGEQRELTLGESTIPQFSNTMATPRRPSAIRLETVRRDSNASDAATIIGWGDGSNSPAPASTPVPDEIDHFSSSFEQSPSVGRMRLRTLDMYNHSPPESPQSIVISKRQSLPSPTSSTYSISDLSDTSSLSLDAPIFDDIQVSESLPYSKPRKRSDDQLQQQISSLLESLPAKIRLTSEPDVNATSTLRPKKTRRSVTPSFRSHSSLSNRAPTPSFLLSPAYSRTASRPRPQSSNPEIKLYHLSRSTGEAPIKLFVRLVGENGERVMVRVGGGWADLGEYLKEYASHHGRRSGGGENDKIEIQDLPPRIVSSSSTTSTATLRGGESGRSSPAPQFRPTPALDRPMSSLNVRKTRKSLGETGTADARRDFRSPSTPLPIPNRRSLGAETGTPTNTTSTPTIGRSASRLSWTNPNEEVSLGLAGPTGKNVEISERDKEWVESMKEKVKQASAEKDREREREKRVKERERGASFGEMGKIGGTKRLFRKA